MKPVSITAAMSFFGQPARPWDRARRRLVAVAEIAQGQALQKNQHRLGWCDAPSISEMGHERWAGQAAGPAMSAMPR